MMVSIYDWFGYEVSIKDRHQLIKAAGFDGVLLWWSDGFGRGADYREKEIHGNSYRHPKKYELLMCKFSDVTKIYAFSLV